MPEYTFTTPVPVVARIEWAEDGVGELVTGALGWSNGRRVRAAARQPVEVHRGVAGRLRCEARVVRARCGFRVGSV